MANEISSQKDGDMQGEMQIDTEEFLAVLKRLKPKKITKASLAEDLYIALFNGEAIFCVRGIQTKCLIEKGHWDGYITVNAGVVQSFLTARPKGPVVTLKVKGNLFQIENLKVPCKTMQSPEWITAMSFEAHLHDDLQKSPAKIDRYCPKCGKKRGEYLKLKLAQKTLIDDPLPSKRPPKYPSTRKCSACTYEWLECDDLVDE